MDVNNLTKIEAICEQTILHNNWIKFEKLMLKKESEICGREKINKPSYMDLMYFYVQVNHDYKKALETTEKFLENSKIDISY